MSDDLRELYQEVILDHTKRPRNFGRPDAFTHSAEGHNPVCGDELEVFLDLEDDRVASARFQGKGCAISTASASLMTQAVAGKHVDAVKGLFERFHSTVTSPPDSPVDADALGKLAVFAGVREFPMRVKCASLCWHTLAAAVRGDAEPVTTE